MPTGHKHSVNKVAERVVSTAAVALDRKLVATHTVTKESMDIFKGVEGETITKWVPGTLPVRVYEWKNDRSEPLRADVYKETKIDLTIAPNNNYSAVKLTDEDKEFDFDGKFGRLHDAQTTAISDKLDYKVTKLIKNAPYEVHMTIDPSSANIKAEAEMGRDLFYNWFADIRAALVKMRAPGTQFYALVGSEIASHLRKNQKLVKETGNGDNAFSTYVIDTYAGITAIEDLSLPANEGYVYDSSGFMLFTAAPSIPDGATKGAIVNQNGVSMRWLQDYDHDFQIDRSTFNTWDATSYAKDMLKQINEDETQIVVGSEQYFLRGVKISIGAASTSFVPGDGKNNGGERAGANSNSELARVWNGRPFTGTLPTGEYLSNTLLAANAYADEVATAPAGE